MGRSPWTLAPCHPQALARLAHLCHRRKRDWQPTALARASCPAARHPASSAFARGLPPPPRRAPSAAQGVPPSPPGRGLPRRAWPLSIPTTFVGDLLCAPGMGGLCRHVNPSAPSELCDFPDLPGTRPPHLSRGGKEVGETLCAKRFAWCLARDAESRNPGHRRLSVSRRAACPLPVLTPPAPTAPVRAEPPAPWPGQCPAPSRRTGPRIP